MHKPATAKIIGLLQETKTLLRRHGNDFSQSHWDGFADAEAEIDQLSERIVRGDISALTALEILFAPTGSIQEVSLSSGWDKEFLNLSARVDQAIADLKKTVAR